MSGPNFELPPGWDEMARRLREQLDKSGAIFRTSAAAAEQFRLHFEAITEHMAKWGPVLEQMGRDFVESWNESMAPNWEGYNEGTEQVMALVERVDRTGFCLVWLPRPDILREVMDASESETAPILLRHSREVLDDATALLAEVVEPELALERDAAMACVRALREGHTLPAQALAASVFTSILHGQFERSLGQAARRMEETDPKDAALRELRLRTIYVAGARAMSDYNPWTDDPVCPTFNRHNTGHRITREQWTDANALSAIMLVVAFLRELQYWAERRRGDLSDAA